MKTEDLIGIGLTEEQAKQVFEMHGKDINKEKALTTAAKADAEALRGQLADRDKDLEALRASTGDAEALRGQLQELQSKYDKDTSDYKTQLAARDYAAAASAAISGAGVKFSSKGAEKAFMAELNAKALELRDGKLTGFDEFLNAQKEADPGAFASGKPTPNFGRPVGTGGGAGCNGVENIGVALAKAIGASAAQNNKAYSDVMSTYKGE